MAFDTPQPAFRLPWVSSLMIFAAVGLAIALSDSAALVAQSASGDPTVRVAGGEIRGRVVDGGGAAFKGVPYADPPLGDLRWRDPAPVKPWSGIRDAGALTPECTQPGRQGALGGQEDCLYLNVWTSEWPSKSPKPVMVWLYGGSNVGGTSSVAYLDGVSLSRHGVIVVTLNFRLGVFGFMAHPGLTAESSHHTSGNYGILDQIAALKWVHDNIAQFGGDPKRVTLFGQSSGGMDVSFLVASQLSKGLIQRGIQESGPPVRVAEPMSETEKKGEEFAAFLKAPADPAAAIKYMRSISGPDLEAASLKQHPHTSGEAAVTEIDGYVIRKYAALIYKDGDDQPIPMLIGNNAQEQTHSYKPAMMIKWVEENYGSLAPQAEEFYGLANGGAGNTDPLFGPVGNQITADTRQRCPAIAEGDWRSSHGHPTYEYMWDPPVAGEAATRHAAEIPFVFGNLLSKGEYSGPFTDADRKISEQVQTYWTNFAKTGDPNGSGLPEWPKFNATDRPYLEFTLHDGPQVHQNLRRNICDIYIQGLKETIPAGTASTYPE